MAGGGGVKIEKYGDIFYGWFLNKNSSAYPASDS